MSWLRDKPPEQVKADALRMAARKHDEGCRPCARAYLDLARRYGATEIEVIDALHSGARRR